VVNDRTILFDVHPTRVAKWKRTMDNFTVAAMGKGLSDELKAAIATQLLNNHKLILGYDKHESMKYEEPETFDDSIKPMTVTEAVRTHSGTVSIKGMIVTRSKLYQLIDTARWVCLNCKELIEKKVSNILEPPTRPKECVQCESKTFEEKHDLINTVTLGLQERRNSRTG